MESHRQHLIIPATIYNSMLSKPWKLTWTLMSQVSIKGQVGLEHCVSGLRYSVSSPSEVQIDQYILGPLVFCHNLGNRPMISVCCEKCVFSNFVFSENWSFSPFMVWGFSVYTAHQKSFCCWRTHTQFEEPTTDLPLPFLVNTWLWDAPHATPNLFPDRSWFLNSCVHILFCF